MAKRTREPIVSLGALDKGAGCGPKVRFIGSDIYRQPAFGRHHPLSISRVESVVDLCTICGWLPVGVTSSPVASVTDLTRFHTIAYIDALRLAEARGSVSIGCRERFCIGTMENPVFPGFFERASTTVGGSIMAARLALEDGVAFHPAGGTHHGRPDRASGFCYLNDPVFALLTLLDSGLDRVVYVDLDVHHGDGVEDAFAHDKRVTTISVHEADRWPGTGLPDDAREGRAWNIAAPPRLNDSEFNHLMVEAVLPVARAFSPQAIVIVCGTDALKGDPLSTMELSNGALWAAVEQLIQLSKTTVVLGGGGYNPWTLVRCWAGLWARLAGYTIPPRLNHEAGAVLSRLTCDLVDDEDIDPNWRVSIQDLPNFGETRPLVRQCAATVRARLT